MEELIASISAEGPHAKRPPHIWLTVLNGGDAVSLTSDPVQMEVR